MLLKIIEQYLLNISLSKSFIVIHSILASIYANVPILQARKLGYIDCRTHVAEIYILIIVDFQSSHPSHKTLIKVLCKAVGYKINAHKSIL